jgi:hypothetical protein
MLKLAVSTFFFKGEVTLYKERRLYNYDRDKRFVVNRFDSEE